MCTFKMPFDNTSLLLILLCNNMVDVKVENKADFGCSNS